MLNCTLVAVLVVLAVAFNTVGSLPTSSGTNDVFYHVSVTFYGTAACDNETATMLTYEVDEIPIAYEEQVCATAYQCEPITDFNITWSSTSYCTDTFPDIEQGYLVQIPSTGNEYSLTTWYYSPVVNECFLEMNEGGIDFYQMVVCSDHYFYWFTCRDDQCTRGCSLSRFLITDTEYCSGGASISDIPLKPYQMLVSYFGSSSCDSSNSTQEYDYQVFDYNIGGSDACWPSDECVSNGDLGPVPSSYQSFCFDDPSEYFGPSGNYAGTYNYGGDAPADCTQFNSSDYYAIQLITTQADASDCIPRPGNYGNDFSYSYYSVITTCNETAVYTTAYLGSWTCDASEAGEIIIQTRTLGCGFINPLNQYVDPIYLGNFYSACHIGNTTLPPSSVFSPPVFPPATTP